MDFAETEDQKMIRGMVREFAEDVAGPTVTREIRNKLHLLRNSKNSQN